MTAFAFTCGAVAGVLIKVAANARSKRHYLYRESFCILLLTSDPCDLRSPSSEPWIHVMLSVTFAFGAVAYVDSEQVLLDKLNKLRAQRGLPPIQRFTTMQVMTEVKDKLAAEVRSHTETEAK